MVQLPRFFESSGVDQSLPMGVMSWSEVLQEPADLVEVWEHGRAIMQGNRSKKQIETKRVEVSARWPDGVSRICGRWEEDGLQRRTGVRWLLGKVPEGADSGWRLGSHLQGAKEGHLQRRGCCAVGLGTRAHHYTPTYQASPLRPSRAA